MIRENVIHVYRKTLESLHSRMGDGRISRFPVFQTSEHPIFGIFPMISRMDHRVLFGTLDDWYGDQSIMVI